MFGTIFMIFVGLILYFLPTIIAAKRKRRNAEAIGLVNLFFGWSIIGWLIALIWAAKHDNNGN